MKALKKILKSAIKIVITSILGYITVVTFCTLIFSPKPMKNNKNGDEGDIDLDYENCLCGDLD